MEQSGLSYADVVEESKSFDFSSITTTEEYIRPQSSTLPQDAINLFDKQQVEYYIDNPIIQETLMLIKHRRLDTAINKPKALYISLTDFIHKNRLIIPFYDYKNRLIWYQTRTVLTKDNIDKPKYMSKLNAEKAVFGINQIDPQLDYIFIQEGPIDAMFIKNGITMCGISMSDTQTEQLARFKFHKKIWILDNQLNNKQVLQQMNTLFDNNERVFIWPKKFASIKDINELCIKTGKDSIRPEFFIDNSYVGLEGTNKLASLTF
jgi:hypothetical protein